MIHFRTGIDPRNARLGWSELKAAVRAICGLNECDTYTAAILRNMGIPGIIIGPGHADVNLQDDDIDIIKDQFREGYTSEHRGEPMVASRMFKVEKISMSPEELRLDKLPARLEDQVCAVIGVPPMVAGVSSGAQHKTYANYGEARKAAYEDCLIPLQKAIAACLTHQLLIDFENTDLGYRVRFDYAGVQCLAEAETEVATRVGRLYKEFELITRAEGRQALGYDFTEDDEVYYSETKPAPPAMIAGPTDPPGDDSELEPKNNDNEDDAARSKRQRNIASEVLPAAVWGRLDRTIELVDQELKRRARVAGRRHDPAGSDLAA
jgi:HK97 family phage portal protein